MKDAEKSKKNPPCPSCGSNNTISNGQRKNRKRTVKKYKCKVCSHYFTQQPELQANKTYELKTILNAISAYNLGTSLRKMSLKHSIFQTQIPKSTIHDWIKSISLPMNRLRKRIKNNPIIKQQFIHHKQPFLFQYHSIKLNFAKKFPYLIKYLTTLNESLPKDIFKNSIRISETAKETLTTMARRDGGCPRRGVTQGFFKEKTVEAINVVGVSDIKNCTPQDINVVGVSESSINQKNEFETFDFLNKELKAKQNYAVELAKLASAITEDNKKRHQIIENFMLINDTATIAVEIPVFLKENNKILTGHIDILQLRYNQIHILDYKPEPFNKEQAINQLILYRKALSNLTNIPENYFKLAFFNEKGYYELSGYFGFNKSNRMLT